MLAGLPHDTTRRKDCADASSRIEESTQAATVTPADSAPRTGKQSRSVMHRLAIAVGPIGKPLAGTRWLPLYAVLRHTGRKSGRRYAIPVVAFRTLDGFVLPLPFGEATQWFHNLFAADGAIRWRAQEYTIGRPELVDHDDAAVSGAVPGFLRTAARRLGIRRWVRVRDHG